jgi:hypothetical protein
MTSFVVSAKYVHDVDSDLAYVEIVYERYIRSKGEYVTFTDFLTGEPRADWTYIKSKNRSIPYEKFLDTMVSKTLEVRQRIAELTLETILSYDQDESCYIRLAHAVKIIDPTFQAPRVNMRSAWQMGFMKKFCKKEIPNAIQVCTKNGRLDYFINVLRRIELEL